MFKEPKYQVKNAISNLGTVIIALALAILLAHYITAAFQPVRWPTRYYFYGMFWISIFVNQRMAIMFFVFALPIIPDLHLQLEAVRPPSVKYFVAHPGLDLVGGLCLGLWIKKMWIAKKIQPVFERVHWALGLLVITITVSVILAVMQNAYITNLFDINFIELFDQLLRFKLMNYPNNYLPIADWMSYCFAILTICILTPYLQTLDIQQREKTIFIPLIYSVILSALWGIFQSLTGLGLLQVTLDYRPASFGFGAQGFQPDIHAFAAIMLLGTIGLLGFLKRADGREVLLIYFCIVISWIALVLSKSKATFISALLVSAIYMLMHARAKGVSLFTIAKHTVAVFVVLVLVLFLTKNFVWIDALGAFLFTPASWTAENFNTAFVYRPELFRAALLMFVDSPIFGVGQGNVFRLSSNIDLTQSIYMAQKGGENAHNYFLQTLAETGVVGISVFIFAIAWPFLKTRPLSKIASPAIALLAIALGNVFSHPLLIRPNLILLAIFLSMMYAGLDRSKSQIRFQRTV